jgi:hypothetical protein
VACVSIGSIIINFDAIDYIFTRKGSFLRFKDRSTANQKLTEKKLMVDRNCCPCMFCHSDNILPKERPSLTSICHGEEALSLRIPSRPEPQKKIQALSIANSRTAPESSVYLPEIAWNKM